MVEPGTSIAEQESFVPPHTLEEFDAFVEQQLGERLVPVSEQELQDVKLHWRGLNPAEGLGLLADVQPEVELHSKYPNTTIDWHKAVPYNRGGDDMKYNLALGFMPEDDWEIKPASGLSKDIEALPGVLNYERGNFVVNGKLHKEDVRYLIARGHGGKPGQVGEYRFYRVEQADS